MRRALFAVIFALVAQLGSPHAHAASAWSPATSLFYFDPSGEDPYLSPIVTVNRRALHLEARYNYEDLDTGSFFAGWTFEGGDNVIMSLTPLVGVVIGRTDALAPGLEAGLVWREVEVYAETEWVIPFDDDSDDFLYAWLEATIAPVEFLHVGLAAQRTRAYESGLEIQRGPMVVVPYSAWSFGAYWFNPDRSADDVRVLALGYQW